MTLAEILAEFKRIYQEAPRPGPGAEPERGPGLGLHLLGRAPGGPGGGRALSGPVDHRRPGPGSAKRASGSTPTTTCLIAHDWLGQIQEGVYDYLEGLVHADICSPGRSIIEAVNYLELIPSSFALSFPTENNATTRRFFKAELKELIHFLEGLTGRKVGDEDLWRGIHRQRRKRELLRRLARLREERATALTGSQACRVVLAGLVAGTDRFNSLLAELLAAPERPGRAPEEGVRIMVSSLLVEEAARSDQDDRGDGRAGLHGRFPPGAPLLLRARSSRAGRAIPWSSWRPNIWAGSRPPTGSPRSTATRCWRARPCGPGPGALSLFCPATASPRSSSIRP